MTTPRTTPRTTPLTSFGPTSWVRVALGYLIVVSAQIGVWALFAPRSFYDDFPGLGRSWVSADGPFNEHLVRDVGALNLALTALFVIAWARPRRTLVVASACAALVWGVPHAIYHVIHTAGLDTVDLVASLGGLVLYAVLGVGLLWASARLEDQS